MSSQQFLHTARTPADTHLPALQGQRLDWIPELALFALGGGCSQHGKDVKPWHVNHQSAPNKDDTKPIACFQTSNRRQWTILRRPSRQMRSNHGLRMMKGQLNTFWVFLNFGSQLFFYEPGHLSDHPHISLYLPSCSHHSYLLTFYPVASHPCEGVIPKLKDVVAQSNRTRVTFSQKQNGSAGSIPRCPHIRNKPTTVDKRWLLNE